MGSQSKRMMNAKQDQYREYVIEKLLAETTIGIVNDYLSGDYPNNRYITIKTPFYDSFTVITPKDGVIGISEYPNLPKGQQRSYFRLY